MSFIDLHCLYFCVYLFWVILSLQHFYLSVMFTLFYHIKLLLPILLNDLQLMFCTAATQYEALSLINMI